MVQVHYVYNASLALDPGPPRSYGEAMAGPNSKKWAAAVSKEIKNFNKRELWAQVPRETMGRGQKALHTRWIFKIKVDNNGNQLFKARLVVKGYEQVPGVNFTEACSPMARDATICTVLATVMHLGWNCEAIDVEAAFLNADLEKMGSSKFPKASKRGGGSKVTTFANCSRHSTELFKPHAAGGRPS